MRRYRLSARFAHRPLKLAKIEIAEQFQPDGFSVVPFLFDTQME